MPCTPYSLNGPNGPITGIICTPKRRVVFCSYCQKPHTHLCDHPTTKGKTCDRKLCADHRTPAGQSDFCPEHRASAVQGALKLLER